MIAICNVRPCAVEIGIWIIICMITAFFKKKKWYSSTVPFSFNKNILREWDVDIMVMWYAYIHESSFGLLKSAGVQLYFINLRLVCFIIFISLLFSLIAFTLFLSANYFSLFRIRGYFRDKTDRQFDLKLHLAFGRCIYLFINTHQPISYDQSYESRSRLGLLTLQARRAGGIVVWRVTGGSWSEEDIIIMATMTSSFLIIKWNRRTNNNETRGWELCTQTHTISVFYRLYCTIWETGGRCAL